jgi:hypothetical protein
MAPERNTEIRRVERPNRKGVHGRRGEVADDNDSGQKTGDGSQVRKVRSTGRKVGTKSRSVRNPSGYRGIPRCYFCQGEATHVSQFVGYDGETKTRLLCDFAAEAWRECYNWLAIRSIGREKTNEMAVHVEANPR